MRSYKGLADNTYLIKENSTCLAMINNKLIRIAVVSVFFIFLLFSFAHVNYDLSPTKIAPKIVPNEIPLEKRIPGAFLEYEQYLPGNESYCDYHYGFPKELTFNPSDVDIPPEMGKGTTYRILYNVIAAKMSGDIPSITYATHVSADFVPYLPELLKYWDGYVSMAAFVPDTDVALVLEQLHQMCYCLPDMSRVSVHLVFSYKVPPSRKDVFFKDPTDCKVMDASKIEPYNRYIDTSVVYPINVCRNAARSAALTELVLVSDIQLMPSGGLASKFMKMLEKNQDMANCKNQVYVLPIFEVESDEIIPRTKKELIELVRQDRACYFHKHICNHCQKFPGIETWLLSKPGEEVKPLLVSRREMPYHRWEPIYIGTKNEPYYNEALSWEGLQDKMLQTLEMCLIGYKFVILDGAFLIHWPGMKKTKTAKETWRLEFVKENNIEYEKLLKNLTKRYVPKAQCKPR